ncbi:MAG: DivIVA domain-containing protein [Mycobacteriaceae bacterium]
MSLTPEEVREVTFPRAPWIRRGYHEDSVDAFLDYVTEELTRLRVDYRALARLTEENYELRLQLAERTETPGTRAQWPSAERSGAHRYAAASDDPRSAQHF